MGYTDKHGRPELVAQPFIKKGASNWRVVDDSEVEEDQASDEAAAAGTGTTPKPTPGPTPA